LGRALAARLPRRRRRALAGFDELARAEGGTTNAPVGLTPLDPSDAGSGVKPGLEKSPVYRTGQMLGETSPESSTVQRVGSLAEQSVTCRIRQESAMMAVGRLIFVDSAGTSDLRGAVWTPGRDQGAISTSRIVRGSNGFWRNGKTDRRDRVVGAGGFFAAARFGGGRGARASPAVVAGRARVGASRYR
jgi:hypothetical protein